MTAAHSNIKIDSDLHRRLKIRAARTGKTIIEETEAAIRDRLKQPANEAPAAVANPTKSE